MAVRFDAATQTIKATGSPLGAYPVTAFFRARRRGDGGSVGGVIVNGERTGGGSRLQVSYAGGQFGLWNGAGWVMRETVADDVWYDIAVTQSGSGAGQALLYTALTGSTGGIGSSATTGPPTNELQVVQLSFPDAGYWANVEIDDFRMWSVVLTADEIERERRRRVPRFADLVHWLPLHYESAADCAIDRAGGASFTVSGSPYAAPGAPVPWSALAMMGSGQ